MIVTGAFGLPSASSCGSEVWPSTSGNHTSVHKPRTATRLPESRNSSFFTFSSSIRIDPSARRRR
jgi:hypothetical protein